jgi:hypothetical protein
MTNWKIYTTFGAMSGSTGSRDFKIVKVDDWIEFSDGYEKEINVDWLPWKLNKQYIEIDIGETRLFPRDRIFGSNVIRKVPLDVVRRREREEMIRTASVDPTALAITRQGMDRVDQNQQNEFEYKMEDNSGNKHQWTYRHKKY